MSPTTGLEPDRALFAMVDALDEHLEIMSADTHAAFSVLHHAVAAFEAGADDLIISQANRVRFMLIGKPEAFDPREEAVARFLLAAADAAIKLAGYSSTQPEPTGVLGVVKQRWAALESVFDAHRKQSERVWYHGTGRAFGPGETISPRSETGAPNLGGPADWVFAASSVAEASRYIREQPDGPHIYEVRPLGEVVANPQVPTEAATREGWEVVAEVPEPEEGWWSWRTERGVLGSKEALAFDDQRAWQLTSKVVDLYESDGPGPITSVEQAEREMARLVGPGKRVPVKMDPSMPYGNAHVAWTWDHEPVEMTLGNGGAPFIAFLHEVAHLVAGYQGAEKHSEAWAREFARKLRETGLDRAAKLWEVLWTGPDTLDFFYGTHEQLRSGGTITATGDEYADYGFVHQTTRGALDDAEESWHHEWHEGIEDKVYLYRVKPLSDDIELIYRPGRVDGDEVHCPAGWVIAGVMGSKKAMGSLRTCGMADGQMLGENPLVYWAEWLVRDEVPVPSFDLDGATDWLRRILTEEGVPMADEAFVRNHSGFQPNKARIGWFRDAPAAPTPFVEMGANARDLMTLVHEAAHIVTNRGVLSTSTEQAHNDEWLDNYLRMLARWLPEAAELLSTHMERDQAVAAKTASALPRNLYWRFHDPERPFTEEEAHSTPFKRDRHWTGTQPGFSSWDDPWVLYSYAFRQRWVLEGVIDDDEVIGFQGTQVGTGVDGEPLVVPDGDPVYRKPVGQFLADLVDTPLPDPTTHPTYSSTDTVWNPWYLFAGDCARNPRNPAEQELARRLEANEIPPFLPTVSQETRDRAWPDPPDWVTKTAFAERLEWRVVDPRPERQTVEAVYLGIRFRLQGRDKDPSGNGGWTLDLLEPGDDVQLVVLHHHQFDDDYWNREVKRYHDTLEEAKRYVEERIIGTGMVDQMVPRDLFPQGSTRYHLTLARHVGSILSRGLEPRSQVGTGTSVFSELRKVTSILWDLKDEDWAAYQDEPIALLELDVSGLPRSTVKDLSGEERVNATIEPSRISVLVPDIPWYLTESRFSSWSLSESEALALLRRDPGVTRRAWSGAPEELDELMKQGARGDDPRSLVREGPVTLYRGMVLRDLPEDLERHLLSTDEHDRETWKDRGQRLVEYLRSRPQGLGTHWTTDRQVALSLGLAHAGGMAVLLEAQWDGSSGLAERQYGHGGESEVTLEPHAPLEVTGVHLVTGSGREEPMLTRSATYQHPQALKVAASGLRMERRGDTFSSYVVAWDGDEVVGALWFDQDLGDVNRVYVRPGRRREGIATAMAQEAEEWAGKPLTFGDMLSPSGAAWADAIEPDEQHLPTWGTEGQWAQWLEQLQAEARSKTATYQHPVGVMEDAHTKDGTEGKSFTSLKAVAEFLRETLWSAGSVREVLVADRPDKISGDLIGDRTGVIVVTEAPQFFSSGGVGADARAFVSPVPQSPPIDYVLYLPRLPVSEMVLLHEAAHIINGLQGGSFGHEQDWAKLYIKLLDNSWDPDLQGLANLVRFATGLGATASGSQVWWHTTRGRGAVDLSRDEPIHLGTQQAAEQHGYGFGKAESFVHEGPVGDHVFDDDIANLLEDVARGEVSREEAERDLDGETLVAAQPFLDGRAGLLYRNSTEDPGSLSLLTYPRFLRGLGTTAASGDPDLKVMYHISAGHNRESIQEHGLRLAEGFYDPETRSRTGRYIWLFADRETAEAKLPGSWGGSTGFNDLWEVDVSGYEVQPDPHPGWEGVQAYVVTESIGPERVRLVKTVTKQGVRDVWYHSGGDPRRYEVSAGDFGWPHLGTYEAASVRGNMWLERAMYEVRIAPRNPVNSESNPADDFDANRIDQWLRLGAPRDEDGQPIIPEEHISNSSDLANLRNAVQTIGFDEKRHDAIYYRNDVEHSGSVSVMVDPKAIVSAEPVHGGQTRLFAAKNVTVYRGMEVKVPGQPEDYDSLDQWVQAVTQAMTSYHPSWKGQLGRSWSTSREVAVRFSAESRHTTDAPVRASASYTYVPVVVEGQVSSSDEDWLRDTADYGGGFEWEREFHLRDGAEVQVTRMSVALPDDLDTYRVFGPSDEGREWRETTWHDAPVNRTFTAAADVTYRYIHPNEGAYPAHVVAALKDGQVVGVMTWFKGLRAGLAVVWVAKEHRRQGIATGMWSEALRVEPELRHSDMRSPAGDNWARSVGGPGLDEPRQRITNTEGEENGQAIARSIQRYLDQQTTAIARPATIYRGMGVRLGDTWEDRDINWGEFMDHYESGDHQAMANLVLEHIEGFGEGTVGVHWTFEDEVAERFALRARGPATVPTVLVGEVDLGQVGIEEDPSGEGYAVYDIEQEYPVKRGAQVSLREMRLWVPMAGRFITIPVDRQVTAAYEPQHGGPWPGEWDRSGDEPRWVADHDDLVARALSSWKSWPTAMRTHMDAERRGEPMPGSGSGKQMRTEAAALLWELEHNSRTNPMTLYRTDHDPSLRFVEGWSEDETFARIWSGANPSGERPPIWRLEPGQARGIRIADYLHDAEEREWLIIEHRAEPVRVTAVRGDGDGFVYTTDGERFWGVHGAAGLLVRHVDEDGITWFFLQKRSGAVEEGGTWSIPGGAIDSHETPTQAALREFSEETGLPTHGLGVVGTYVSQPVPEWSYTTVVAETPDALDTPDLVGWEQEDSGWFTLDEMRSMSLHPGLRDSLDDVARFAIARPATIYRGLKVEFRDGAAWEEFASAVASGNDQAAARALHRRMLEHADEQRPFGGHRDRDAHVGYHWTVDRSTAEDFAGWFHLDFDERTADIPVVLEARWELGEDVIEEPGAYGGHGRFVFHDENEVWVRPGAPLTITRVTFWVPDDLDERIEQQVSLGSHPFKGGPFPLTRHDVSTSITTQAAAEVMYRGLRVAVPTEDYVAFLEDPSGQASGDRFIRPHLRDDDSRAWWSPFETIAQDYAGGVVVEGDTTHIGVVLRAQAEAEDIEFIESAPMHPEGMYETTGPVRVFGYRVAVPREVPDSIEGLRLGPAPEQVSWAGEFWWGHTAGVEDYGGGHRPPSDGPPLHDLLAPSPEGGKLYPDDVYTHPHYYTFGEHAAEATRIIQRVRGKPDATVTIYRSIPPTEDATINTGDWVSITEGYARHHGFDRGWDEWVEHPVSDEYPMGGVWERREGDWPVVAAEVPAHTVRNGGNDLIEWGYWGPPIRGVIKQAIARPRALWRGYIFEATPAEWERYVKATETGNDDAWLVDFALSRKPDPEMGPGVSLDGVGVHWTPIREQAEMFAEGYPNLAHPGPRHVSVVLRGSPRVGNFEYNEPDRRQRYDLHHTEDEVSLRAGAEVDLEEVWLLPKSRAYIEHYQESNPEWAAELQERYDRWARGETGRERGGGTYYRVTNVNRVVPASLSSLDQAPVPA